MLLVLEGHLLLKELPDLPDLAVGQPPGGGGDHQVVPARLEVVDDTLVALRKALVQVQAPVPTDPQVE